MSNHSHKSRVARYSHRIVQDAESGLEVTEILERPAGQIFYIRVPDPNASQMLGLVLTGQQFESLPALISDLRTVQAREATMPQKKPMQSKKEREEEKRKERFLKALTATPLR